MNFLTSLLLKKYKPRLVVVFGLHGRSEARKAIHAVLSAHTTVLSSSVKLCGEEINREIGGIIPKIKTLLTQSSFPHVILVDSLPDNKEYKKLRKILGIDTAVITPVGDIPSFVNLFPGSMTMARHILKEVRIARQTIMCGDDESLVDISAELTRKPIMFGFDQINDIRIESASPELKIKRKAYGRTRVKVEHDGNFVPFYIPDSFGKRNTYAAGAALGVSLAYEINFVNATQELRKYESPEHALHLLSGIKSTAIISAIKDTTPYMAREAIELMGRFRDSGSIAHSIIVLADIILDKEGETEGLHRYLGELAAHNADLLVLAGERIVFTEEEAKKHGMRAENIFRFYNLEDAALKTQEIMKKMNGVLVLGSEETGLKKVIDEIKAQ
ncbi:MAG: hypothetical protein WD712_02460 [Candidatus Spechtbacterales bacterium]